MVGGLRAEPQEYQLLFASIMLVFGLVGWLMVFLETYRHFPKMEKTERIRLSVTNATVMTIMLVVVCYIALQLLEVEALK